MTNNFNDNDLKFPIQPLSQMGSLLVDLGKLTPDQLDKIVEFQLQTKLKFGEAAVKLGFVSEEDIQDALARQFDFPTFNAEISGFSRDLIAAYEPFTDATEKLRNLRSQLIVQWFAQNKKTLTIVGSTKGDGCSFISANLAIVFSQLGAKTLLIDANLRAPSQAELFNLRNAQGLSDILAQRANLDAIQKIPNFIDLSVLPAGTIPPNPQEMLSRPLFGKLINIFSNEYDVVLIDTAPTETCLDAQTVCARTGAAMLVTRVNYSKHEKLAEAKKLIGNTGAKILGVVLNEY